jgi:hypothetical protein
MRTTKTLAASDAAGPPFGGTLAQEHITVLLVSIGMRLNRGATAYYRAAWDLGMAEWRLLLVLTAPNRSMSVNCPKSPISTKPPSAQACLFWGNANWSRSSRRGRGRAFIAKLTAEGKKLSARLMQVSLERQARLFKDFARADKARLNALLHQVSQALPMRIGSISS